MGICQLTWDVGPSLLYSCLAIFISLLLYHTNRYRSCIYIYIATPARRIAQSCKQRMANMQGMICLYCLWLINPNHYFFLDPVKPSCLLLQSPIDGSDADACLLIHGANDVTIRHQDHHMPSTLAGDLTKPVVSSTKIMAYPLVN